MRTPMRFIVTATLIVSFSRHAASPSTPAARFTGNGELLASPIQASERFALDAQLRAPGRFHSQQQEKQAPKHIVSDRPSGPDRFSLVARVSAKDAPEGGPACGVENLFQNGFE